MRVDRAWYVCLLERVSVAWCQVDRVATPKTKVQDTSYKQDVRRRRVSCEAQWPPPSREFTCPKQLPCHSVVGHSGSDKVTPRRSNRC